jgi:hypothetical protein
MEAEVSPRRRRVRWCLSVGGSTIAVSLLACSGQIDGTGSIPETGPIDPPPPIDAGKPDVTPKPPCTDTDPSCKTSCGGEWTPPDIHSPATKNPVCNDTQIIALADACAKDPTTAGCTTARNAAGACGMCLFGQQTDALWKMIVLEPGATPPWHLNQPGCIELKSGVKDCGKKYFTVVSCFDAYCNECAGAEESSCQKDVAQGTGECKQYLVDQTCANALDAVEKSCFPSDSTDAALKQMFINMAAVFCKS